MAIITRLQENGDSVAVVFSDGSRLLANPINHGFLWRVPTNDNKLKTLRLLGDTMALFFENDITVLAYRAGNNLWYVAPNDEPAPPYIFRWPFAPGGIDSEWGYREPIDTNGDGIPDTSDFHSGCDWSNPAGTPILSAGNGTVYMVRAKGTGGSPGGTSWGNRVIIYHGAPLGADLYTGYAHMTDSGFPAVSEGQTVVAGQVIGYVGTTGSSTGNHLHFSTFSGGLAIGTSSNPLNCINPRDFMATYNPEGWVA